MRNTARSANIDSNGSRAVDASICPATAGAGRSFANEQDANGDATHPPVAESAYADGIVQTIYPSSSAFPFLCVDP